MINQAIIDIGLFLVVYGGLIAYVIKLTEAKRKKQQSWLKVYPWVFLYLKSTWHQNNIYYYYFKCF